MKKNLIKVVVLVAVCALGLSGEAFAGKGGGNARSTHSATKVQSQSKTKLQSQIKTQSRQQLNTDSVDAMATSSGTGKASQRKPGLADGSGLAPQPLDGSGFGSPAN